MDATHWATLPALRRAARETFSRSLSVQRGQRRQRVQKLREWLLPYCGSGMRPMAARCRTNRNHDEASGGHALDQPLHDAKLRRIDLIVGRVDGEHRNLDPRQQGLGIVIARRIEGVEKIVRVGVAHARVEEARDDRVGRVARWRIAMLYKRSAAHDVQHLQRSAY